MIDKLTMWMNGFFLAALPVFEYLKDNITELQPYIPESTYKIVGISVVIANLFLRARSLKK